MALRKEKPEAVELYKKLLVIFAGVTVVLTALLGITSLWMPLIAAVLALLPAFLWKYPAVRIFTRLYEVLLLAAAPAMLVVILCMGMFHTEYFSLFVVTQLMLPAAALAAIQGAKFDVVFMRVTGLIYAVESALFIAYILPAKEIVTLVLFGAVALVMLVLPLLAYPIDLSRFSKKKA